MMFLYLLPPDIAVPAGTATGAHDLPAPPRQPASVRRAGSGERGAQRCEIERPGQAQRPREGPLPLGEDKTFGPRMHIGTASREAPPRIGPEARGSRLGRHRDDSEQQILRTPFPASDAHTHGDATDFEDYRQASHSLWYRQTHPAPDRGKIDGSTP